MSEILSTPLNEDWELLLSLFPMGWQEQAVLSGALERLRGFDSVADLLRVLLLHVGKGYSLRETAVRARQAGLADISDVAVLKRLRHAGPWWRGLCVALLRERRDLAQGARVVRVSSGRRTPSRRRP